MHLTHALPVESVTLIKTESDSNAFSRQKHQKRSLLHFIYQIRAVLQLFIWGVCFFITKRPPDRRFHGARDTWHSAAHEAAAG